MLRRRNELKNLNVTENNDETKLMETAIRSTADARAAIKSRCDWVWREQGRSKKNKSKCVYLRECILEERGRRSDWVWREQGRSEKNKFEVRVFAGVHSWGEREKKKGGKEEKKRGLQQKVDLTESKGTGRSERRKNRNKVPVLVRAEGEGD